MGRFVGDMDWPRFIAGYLGLLAVGVAGMLCLRNVFGLSLHAAGYEVCALLFVIAAIGRPSYVYRVVRNTGWFAGIESDRTMRRVLLVISLVLFCLALLVGSTPGVV